MWFKKGITLGSTGFFPWQRFFLPEEERKAHLYIVGTTTKGKSKLMEACLGQDILAGSFTRAMPVTPGDVFHADYGRLGSFGFSFGRG